MGAKSLHTVGRGIFQMEEAKKMGPDDSNESGRRGCWAYAAERPGFSIMEVLFIHILCSRWKILAVPHISSAPRRGGHLVGSKQI